MFLLQFLEQADGPEVCGLWQPEEGVLMFEPWGTFLLGFFAGVKLTALLTFLIYESIER